MAYSEFTVIIPVLNEGRNIGRLLQLLTESYKGISILVADDGSRDNTQLAVRSFAERNRNAKLIDRSNAAIKGLTASVMDSVRKANTKYVIIMDGDLQHPPEAIRELAEKLKSLDVVGAARRNVLVSWPWNRKLISMVATELARLRLGKNIQDPLSGFFGARTELFKGVLAKSGKRFEKEGYKVFFDLLKCCPKGTRIGHVYYDFGLRKGGESKIRMRHMLIFFRSLFR